MYFLFYVSFLLSLVLSVCLIFLISLFYHLSSFLPAFSLSLTFSTCNKDQLNLGLNTDNTLSAGSVTWGVRLTQDFTFGHRLVLWGQDIRQSERWSWLIAWPLCPCRVLSRHSYWLSVRAWNWLTPHLGAELLIGFACCSGGCDPPKANCNPPALHLPSAQPPRPPLPNKHTDRWALVLARWFLERWE